MIRWNGKNWIPAGIKPVIGKRRGAPVPGRPKARWVAGWVGGLGEPADPTACDFTFSPIFPPSPTPSITPTTTVTPTVSVTPTPSITPSVTVTPTPSPSVIPFDADAAAYLAEVVASGGTVDATMSAATNTLFVDLKANGFYNNLYFFPMIGGIANSNGIEATLSTYRIDWYGGWTHNASGSTANGINTYGEIVGLNKQTMPGGYGDNTYGMEVFVKNSNSQGYDMQSDNSDKDLIIAQFDVGTTAYIRRNSGFKTGSNTDALGLYASTQTGTTSGTGKLIKNGSTTIINTPQAGLNIGGNSWLGKGGGAGGVSTDSGYSFLYYSNYMTDSQVSTFAGIINDFQTALGRNTYS